MEASMLTRPPFITRKWLLATSLLVCAVPALPVFAQKTPEPAPAVQAPEPPVKTDTPASDTSGTTEIVVTGSRIKSKEYDSTSPVTVITADKAAAAGLISTAEILQGSTAAATSGQINNTFTGYVVGGGAGVNTVSMRGLGAQRTLVLLNGRRMPPAGVGGTVGPVDLNVIPSAFISRYELLKDGASSIYGSDAVAGVINVITRSNFEGLHVESMVNAVQEGGGETYDFSGIWGKSFDRGHISVAVEGYEQKALTTGDRPDFACPQDYFYNADGTRADVIDPATGTYKCFSNTGEGYVGTYAPFGAIGRLSYYGSRGIAPGQTTDGVAGWAFIPFEQRSFSDERDKATTVLSPLKRVSLFAQGEYRPSWLNGAELYSEFLFTHRESEQVAYNQFFPYYSENSTANPFRDGTALISAIFPTYTGPETFADAGFPGLVANPIVLYRNESDQTVDTGRILGGVRGDWGSWSYDGYLSYSKSVGDYTNDAIIKDRVNYGTGTDQDTLEDMPGGVCGTGAPAGCVPLDLFSKDILQDGKFPQAMLDYYFAKDSGTTDYSQFIAEGSVTGDLLTLPAGTLGAAFGVSFRHDSINDRPGPLSVAQNVWGATTAGVTSGSDNLSEAYAEFEVPLIRNIQPLVKELKLNLSARYSYYESVGDNVTYKLGLNWAVNDAIRLRATHGTSFRAPALYELYLKDQTSFLSQNQVDPCINYGATGENGGMVRNDLIRANCAASGLAPDFGGGSTSAQITTGGGKSLRPETSEATTFGFVLTPPGTGFKLAVDFWKIAVDNQISSSGASVVGACYGASDFPTNAYCSLFTRGPDGGIATIDASYRNIPSEETTGVDFTGVYERQFNFGTLSLDAQATYVKNHLTQLFPGDVTYNVQGLIGEPDWVANLHASLHHKDWRLTYTFNYTGASGNLGRYGENGVTDVFYAPGATYAATVPAWATHDISFEYDARNWSILAGISNLTDKAPPILGNGTSFTRLGNYPMSSQYYEGFLGRQFFVRLSRDF